jgi:C4-dicarboxylate-specific signal transduction histidine kinase
MKTGQLLSQTPEETIRFEKALKNVRLSTVGRLVPGLLHEFNNQLQAVQGSMALAMEDLQNPEELRIFLQMGIEGSEKMSELINQMRLIYRTPTLPQPDIELNRLLKQIEAWIGRELSGQNVFLKLALEENPVFFRDNSGCFQLVLFNLIFNLADAITAAGGGKLLLTSKQIERHLELSLSTDPVVGPVDLSFEQQALMGHKGKIIYTQSQAMVKISLPLARKRKAVEGAT